MKVRILGITLALIIILSGMTMPAFAYFRICEDISFDSYVAGDWSTAGASYGEFSLYGDASLYPTGGFYSFTADETMTRSGSGKSLKMARTQQYSSTATPGILYTADNVLKGTINIETSIYIPSYDGFSLYSPRYLSMRANNTIFPLVGFTEAGGRIYMYDGAKLVLTGASEPIWSPDTWYDVKISYDLEKNDVSYNITAADGSSLYNRSYNTAPENEDFKNDIDAVGGLLCLAVQKAIYGNRDEQEKLFTKRNNIY